MTNYRHPAMAFALSLMMLAAALLLLWFGSFAEKLVDDKVIVRQISPVALPPPPPPPPMQTPTVETPMQLQIAGAGAVVQAINIELPQPIQLQKPQAPALAMTTPQFTAEAVNWDAFSLDELDGKPSLLTRLIATLPKSISRSGVSRFVVKLDVYIDQDGRVTLIDMVHNPYPELQPEINRIVKQSRFTPPQKDGEAASARFIWPIEFKQ